MGMILWAILFLLPAAALLSAVLYVPLGWLFGHGRISLLRHLTHFLLLCYGIGLLYLTLFWSGFTWMPGYYMYNLRPFVWLYETYDMGVQAMIEQLVLNVLMFVPLGALLPMNFARLRRWQYTGLCTLAVTCAIETLQLFTGRSADIDDVIMNALGGLLGYALYALACRMLADRGWWRRLLGRPQHVPHCT